MHFTEDFYKPKLFYADITQRLNFCICKEVMFRNNTTYYIATKSEETLEYLYKYLNSPIADWYYRTKSVQLGEKAVRMFSIYMLEIPIPPMIKDIETYKIGGAFMVFCSFFARFSAQMWCCFVLSLLHFLPKLRTKCP